MTPHIIAAQPSSRPMSRAILTEIEPNDNFSMAQAVQPGDLLNGTTGMLANYPVDVFKVQMTAGKVLNVGVHTDSTGYNDKVVRLDVYDMWMERPVAWSHAGFPWEAITCLAKYDDWYYIMIIPWKGSSINYTMMVNVTIPPSVQDGSFVTGAVSNNTNHPADWYSMFLNGSQTSNDVGNGSLSGSNPPDLKFDLYFRDLVPNSWTWWYNFSWWGAFFGQTNTEEAEGAASYTGTYYWDVQAWSGTGPYTLTIRKKTAPSDGDNSPATATEIKRQPGQTQAKFTGTVDMAYDHYDFYKIHLKKGQGMTATMFLQNPWTLAIYRCSILYWNVTTNRWDSLSSWTNIKDPNIVTNQAQAFLGSAPADDDYYIQLMAQVPLHPSNHSNLADWHINKAIAKYQLVVDLPTDELHAPFVKSDAPKMVSAVEDTLSTDLMLSNVFGDQDIGDPDLQDRLKYSTTGTYEHIKISIGNDTNGTVTIIPEKDWNGQTSVTFVATDLYGLQNSTDIRVEVTGVNDPPRLTANIGEVLHDFTVREGTVNQSNNNAVLVDKNADPWSYRGFTDPDLAYGDGLTFKIVSNSTVNAYVPVKIDEQNGYITLKYDAAKITHSTGDTANYTVPITIKATDASGEAVTYTYNITIVENPPDITCSETVVDLQESQVTTLDLNDVCKVATGQRLTFEYIGGGSPNILVKVDVQGNARFSPIGYYSITYGENLNFKAFITTPWQKMVFFTINTVVHDTHPYEIFNPQPDPQIAINIPEGGSKNFSIQIYASSGQTQDFRFTWYVDNVAVASGQNTFRFKPDFSAAEVNGGTHTVRIAVRDGAGGEANFNWTVNVDDTNRKPTARITTPQNNSQFDHGKKVNFIAEASDPDGDPITINWYENGVLLHRARLENGSGIDYWSTNFKAGTTHVIELQVQDDAGLESRYYLTILITPIANPDTIMPLCGYYYCTVPLIALLFVCSSRKTR